MQGQYNERILCTFPNLSNNMQAIELASASLNICKKRVSVKHVLGSNTEDVNTYISKPDRDPLGTVDVPALCSGTRRDVYPQQCSLLQPSYSFAARLTVATVCGLSEHPSV